MIYQSELNKILEFLDLNKIWDLGLNKLIILLSLSTTSFSSTVIVIRVEIFDNLVVIVLE